MTDPLASLTPEQRLAISAALTAAFVAEINALAAAWRERLAAEAAITSPEPEEAAKDAA